MTLLSCSSAPDVSLAPAVVTKLELAPVESLPDIPDILLKSCYTDLLPEEPKSPLIVDLIKNDTDNHVKYNKCYKRQFDLINEILIRIDANEL